MKRLPMPQKHVYEKFYIHEKNIKNLLPEKRKENM